MVLEQIQGLIAIHMINYAQNLREQDITKSHVNGQRLALSSQQTWRLLPKGNPYQGTLQPMHIQGCCFPYFYELQKKKCNLFYDQDPMGSFPFHV